MSGVINRFNGKYFFLSNFEPVQITYEGHTYRTVEHAFQAAKCANKEERILFSEESSEPIYKPGIVKKLGRTVKLRVDWEDVKLGIMKELLVQKFNQEPFRTLLINTGNAKVN